MIALSTRVRDLVAGIEYDFGPLDSSGRERPSVTLLHSTLPGRNAQEIGAAFDRLRALRPRLGVVGARTVISFRPDAPAVSDDVARAIATAWCVRMGFQDFTAVRHDPRHLHICASRIRRDGSVVSDRHDFRRSEQIMRALETEFGVAADRPSHLLDPAAAPPLAARPNQRERARAERAGTQPVKVRLQRLVTAALGKSASLTAFCRSLEALGVEVRLNIASTGTITGISFCLDE